MTRFQHSALGALMLAFAWPDPATGQTVGTFRWQLQPFCNVITVTVVQQAAQYHVDGTDDLCGAARAAGIVGRGFPNPDGSIGFGLTTVSTTGAAWSPSRSAAASRPTRQVAVRWPSVPPGSGCSAEGPGVSTPACTYTGFPSGQGWFAVYVRNAGTSAAHASPFQVFAICATVTP